MNPCARACCWTPFSCATSRDCPCHWGEHAPTQRNHGGTTHSDPTANTAIHHVMKEKGWQ